MRHRITKLLILCGLLMAVSLFPTEVVTAQDGSTTITIHEGRYDPALVTVPVGTSLTWQNADESTYELVSVDNLWQPVLLPPGVSYTRVFEEPGTFRYLSAGLGEPDGSGMTGIVVVEAAPGEADETPAPGGAGGIQDTAQLIVLDQESDGLSITIREVFVTEPSFVVIHQAGADGQIDLVNNIGWTRLEAGSHASVPIFFDVILTGDTLLFATLHRDAGVLDTYEYPGPDEPIEVNGEMVSQSFYVTISGSDAQQTPEPTPEPTPEATPGSVPTTGGDRSVHWMLILGIAMLGSGWLLQREQQRSE